VTGTPNRQRVCWAATKGASQKHFEAQKPPEVLQLDADPRVTLDFPNGIFQVVA
jgi:hypothetical protein